MNRIIIIIHVSHNHQKKFKLENSIESKFEMTYPQVVIIGEDIYIGGGNSIHNVASTVMHCKTTDDGQISCKTLSPHREKNFGMTRIADKLILVGGTNLQSRKKVGDVYRWDTTSQSWKPAYPAVPTARSSLCIVNYDDKFLIAIDGVVQGGQATNIVEKLDLGTKSWSKCPTLPIKASLMTSAVTDSILFIAVNFEELASGPSQKVIYANLTAILDIDSRDCRPVWNTLPDTKLYHSALFASKGRVYSVGGIQQDHKQVKTEIYVYNGYRSEWVLAGALHQPRYQCTCSLLSDQKLIVVGGAGSGGQRITRMDTYSMIGFPESQ